MQKYSFLLVFFLFLGFNVRWVNYFIFIIPYYLPRLFELKKHNLLKLKNNLCLCIYIWIIINATDKQINLWHLYTQFLTIFMKVIL